MPGTVTVGCRLPCGLVIQLYNMEEHQEPLLGGGFKTVMRAVAHGKPVKLNGGARLVGKDSPHDITHGAGLTYNVDADMFTEWLKRNKDLELVKNGSVFAQAKPAEVGAQARAHAAEPTGFERLDPKSLPQEFKGKIATADVAA